MSKKKAIEKCAARLFAAQGLDATTTVQIASEAGATEPMILYRFKGKDELLACILQAAFFQYFSKLDQLSKRDGSHFEKTRSLIEMDFDFVDELPVQTVLVNSACPAEFGDTDGLCARM